MFKFKHLFVVVVFAFTVVSCENYYVHKDGIRTNYSSGISLFEDTLFYSEVIDLNGNRLVGSDSVFFITEITDTIFEAAALVGLTDSTYNQGPLSAINITPIALSLPGFSVTKSSSQLGFISAYNSSDYLFFVNNDGDSVDVYPGFIEQNANNNLFSSTFVTGVDSASLLENVDVSLKIKNNFNFDIIADFVAKSAGQTLFNFRFPLPQGDSLIIDSTVALMPLGKKLNLTLEDVTVIGWTSPVLIDNSNQLSVNLSFDTCEVKTGKIIPYDSRFEIGFDTIALPYNKASKPHLLGISSGVINTELNLNGIDGPFYLIREVSDSNNVFIVDSLLMVQSPSPFVNNIILQNDTIMNQGQIYARYFLRPLAGFPIRLKPQYTIESSYGVLQEWQENYYEGRLMDNIHLSYVRDYSNDPETSHINDSLILRSTAVVSSLKGPLTGKLKLKDSTTITYSQFSNAYVDTAAMEFPFGGNTWDFDAKQLHINQLENSDSSLVGLIIQKINGDILLSSQDSCRIKFDDDLTFKQYSSSLVGFFDGRLGYHANTPLRINQNEVLDSLIYSTDSVRFNFTGIGTAIMPFETTLKIELKNTNGSTLFTDAVECVMDSSQWQSSSFYLPSSKITGETLVLKLSGEIQGYENHHLSLHDYLYLKLNASF